MIHIIDQGVASEQMKEALPECPFDDQETGLPFELSQVFSDVPDIHPIKVEVSYNEASNELSGLHGILISPYIGAKLFLNSYSSVFGYPPTKVKLFKVETKETPNGVWVDAEEIVVKGACTKRLIDYEIKNNTKLFVQQYMELDSNFYNSMLKYIKDFFKATTCILKNCENGKNYEEKTRGSLADRINYDYIPGPSNFKGQGGGDTGSSTTR